MKPRWLLPAASLLAAFAFAIPALARTRPVAQPSPLHPAITLLDQDGRNVLETGQPVSPMPTCGACHDTEFIARHSLHSDAGLSELYDPGPTAAARAWDLGPGPFGRWNPIAYRALSTGTSAPFDLGTPGWLMVFGPRHVGGGPATTSRDGRPLQSLEPDAANPETAVLDPETGLPVAWDWAESGVAEMNCFLCHTASPNNDARVEALESGQFRWAATATLLGSGIVRANPYRWAPEGFEADGTVRGDWLGIQDPENDNCGLCHGLVHDTLQGPLAVAGCAPERYRTVTTGQIISPDRLSDSGMNLEGKENLGRPWDIHAERLLSCTDCHYSLNNPVYDQESQASAPEHLTFDPRRLELGEYLVQPLHQFARGQSAQSRLAPELQGTMRRCESCHDLDAGHDWLPYRDRHAEALACETCHIPQLYSNALQSLDWTVLTLESHPRNDCRGIDGDPNSTAALVTGFQPAVLPQRELDGGTRLAPFNLVTTWLWVHGEPPQPVRLLDLQAVWFEGEGYAPEVLAALDADGDHALAMDELALDTPEKQSLIAGRLAALGLQDPRIVGEVQPYSINHDVAAGEWALSDCQACHGPDSRLSQPIQLAAYTPGDAASALAGDLSPAASPPARDLGPAPVAFVGDTSVIPSGEITSQMDGSLAYLPSTQAEGIYVFGKDSVVWVDRVGGFAFVAVLLGVTAHGGLRAVGRRRRPKSNPGIEAVYMYGFYERLWHWLQTAAIAALLITGLIIHKPEVFGAFSFRHMVLIHNVLAGVLVVNAALSLFYHLASGEIRQFLPRPAGLFDQAISQGLYYLRGIFRGQPHPFHKHPDRKLNPLQQLTYLAILNVLLPLQVLTGLLMWGAQTWPNLTESLGGLPFLAPFHTLIAWLFAAFIVLHVYLTTTGLTPLTHLQAMVQGWEQVEPTLEVDTP